MPWGKLHVLVLDRWGLKVSRIQSRETINHKFALLLINEASLYVQDVFPIGFKPETKKFFLYISDWIWKTQCVEGERAPSIARWSTLTSDSTKGEQCIKTDHSLNFNKQNHY